MSLKPVKKSDQEKDWLKKRNDKKINIFPEYHLIVTEGTKTEPNYFEAIKLRINEKYKNRISLEIRGDGNNTVGLFEDAKESSKAIKDNLVSDTFGLYMIQTISRKIK